MLSIIVCWLAATAVVVLIMWRYARITRLRRSRRPRHAALFHSRAHAAPLGFGEWQPSAGDAGRNFSNRR